jgi:hypothetical protein
MADRGHILYIDGALKWVGPTASEDKNDHNRSWSLAGEENAVVGEEGEDGGGGGLLCHVPPMTVETINTPKWRFRKKNRVKSQEEKEAEKARLKNGGQKSHHAKKSGGKGNVSCVEGLLGQGFWYLIKCQEVGHKSWV